MDGLKQFSLDGRIAVLTGGLGLLGRHFQMGLLKAGARVAVIDQRIPPASDLGALQEWVTNVRLNFYSGDVASRKDMESVLEAVRKQWGVPSILVNNAGIDSPPNAPASENGPFENYPEESLDRIMRVNIKGVFICCQVFGGEMARSGGGSIINLGSIYGLLSPQQDIYEYKRKSGEAWFKPAPYAITKAGVTNLTRYLSTYWAKEGVRVNTLCPSGIANNQDENFLAEYTKRMPIGRMARPEEMVGPLVFLSSDASSYMTGSTVTVDGGWTAW